MKRIILIFIILLSPMLTLADSVSLINQKISPTVLQESSLYKTALSTRKGTAHIILKQTKNEDGVSFFEGKVNNSELVSGISDGKKVILYFSLRGVHFMYESSGVSKLYSRKSLNLACGAKIDSKLNPETESAYYKVATPLAKNLQLSIIVDRSGVDVIGSDYKSIVKAIVSRIDQIYRNNISLSVQRLETITLNSDLSGSDIEAHLSKLQRSRSQLRTSSSSDAVHLITGKSYSDGDPVGLAYLGVICKNSGRYKYGLSHYISKSFQPTLMAHEIGHNLNASHSSSGIMQAVLGGASSTFARDSKSEMKTYISQYGSCLR